MAEKTHPCIQRTKLRIGKDAWEWCTLFNARIDELNCQTCEYRVASPKPLELPKEA